MAPQHHGNQPQGRGKVGAAAFVTAVRSAIVYGAATSENVRSSTTIWLASQNGVLVDPASFDGKDQSPAATCSATLQAADPAPGLPAHRRERRHRFNVPCA
jgi:hypothetical protein